MADAKPTIFLTRHDPIAELEPIHFLERNRQYSAIPKAYNLGSNHLAGAGFDLTEAADRGCGSAGFDQHTDHLRYFASPLERIYLIERLDVRVEINSLGSDH